VMRLCLFIVFCGMIADPAQGGAIVCPASLPDESATTFEKEKWLPKYWGALRSVWISRSYQNGKFLVTNITCARGSGEIMMLTSRFCQLVEGDGRVEKIPDTSAETFVCKTPEKKFTDYNDQTCRVVCED